MHGPPMTLGIMTRAGSRAPGASWHNRSVAVVHRGCSESQVRVLLSLIAGWILGFLAAVLVIIAVGLGVAGVTAGILVRERPGWVENFYLDPSGLVVRALIIGAIAVAVLAASVCLFVRAGKRAR